VTAETPGRATETALVDPVRLAAWLDAQGLEVGRPMVLEALPGGTSNAMFLVDRGASRWVLRRPHRVALARANDGMAREHRILAALGGTDVPHPRVVALCEDHAVLGCTFFLMERVDGVFPLPAPPALDDDVHRAEIAFALVDALARLHEVDWRAIGLADLGRPEHFHERQVDRWTRQLASYEGRELPGMDRVTAWLVANRPTRFQPTLMHGDYHVRNALVAADAPGRVVAILDWETATIGDPLLDLAGFCSVWSSATATGGWPDRHAVLERYLAVRGLDHAADLTYHEVLHHFRLAVLVEGVYQRSRHDPSRPVQHDSGARALQYVARAVELLSAS
jgi:aminoglycoside phosphotransferase (APT) family kinase protein